VLCSGNILNIPCLYWELDFIKKYTKVVRLQMHIKIYTCELWNIHYTCYILSIYVKWAESLFSYCIVVIKLQFSVYSDKNNTSNNR